MAMEFSESSLVFGELVAKLPTHFVEVEVVSFGLEIAPELMQNILKFLQGLLNGVFAHLGEIIKQRGAVVAPQCAGFGGNLTNPVDML
jgi:hypothetical protein